MLTDALLALVPEFAIDFAHVSRPWNLTATQKGSSLTYEYLRIAKHISPNTPSYLTPAEAGPLLLSSGISSGIPRTRSGKCVPR